MANDARPLSARVDAYIANLQSIVAQVYSIADRMEANGLLVGNQIVDGSEQAKELRLSVAPYTVVVDDLTKIVNGERLNEWRIEGQLP